MPKRKINLNGQPASKASAKHTHRRNIQGLSKTKEAAAPAFGISAKLGLKAETLASSRTGLAELINRRLPIATLDALRRHGFDEADIGLIVAERTLRNRKKKNEPLTVEESDRAARLAMIQSQAEGVFGDPDKAHQWLKKPLSALGGATPMMYSRTDAGARVVENMLAKILWGAAA